MSVLVLEVEDSYKDEIKKRLSDLPKDKVKIVEKSAFGILKGRVSDPVKWQEKIREEEQRDVYKSII